MCPFFEGPLIFWGRFHFKAKQTKTTHFGGFPRDKFPNESSKMLSQVAGLLAPGCRAAEDCRRNSVERLKAPVTED